MTISITLTRGYTAIVDDIDADLAELKWRGNPMGHTVYVFGLKKVDGKQKTHQIHREIMERVIGRELKRNEIVDHINRNALDNRRSNLRLCSQKQNMANTRMYSHNTSGYRGVHWNTRLQKWIATCGRQYLGVFTSPELAYEAYKKEALARYGEFFNPGDNS